MIIKYNGQKEYLLNIAGLTRKLPIIEVEKAKTWIASFVMLGDPELTLNCAKKLLNKIKEINFDYIIIPEAKAIPLAETICQLLRAKRKNINYIVLRKSIKSYMQNPLIEEVKSITTSEKQKMVLDGRDAEIIKNKKVLLIDDTLSTGNSFRAMIGLLKNLNVKITNMATVLREGDFDISDIEKQTNLRFLFLENLPLFVK